MPRHNVLAFTYCFPPMALPRSIQVSRLLAGLEASVTVVCGEDPDERRDETIAPQTAADTASNLEKIIRVPFHRFGPLSRLENWANRFYLSWARLPDVQRAWVKEAGQRFFDWQAASGYRPDLLLTFGQPMSDHLFGLEWKRRTGLPWMAHFSDPWTDNPFRRDNPLTAWLNRRLEAQVVAAADRIIFTSPETVDLVMKKYPFSLREKAVYLPHSIDRSRYRPDLEPPAEGYVIRAIGNFYGHRSPRPFFEALERIALQTPNLLNGVVIEFVGMTGRFRSLAGRFPALSGAVKFAGSVSYLESLELMQTAHCLLVIDAPARESVFFPSKLADYIGAGRYILALTPEGASARVVRELGGTAADPADHKAAAEALKKVLTQRPRNLPVRTDRYDQPVVAEEIMRLMELVVCKPKQANQST